MYTINNLHPTPLKKDYWDLNVYIYLYIFFFLFGDLSVRYVAARSSDLYQDLSVFSLKHCNIPQPHIYYYKLRVVGSVHLHG